ncbi:RHOMBOID-like protein 9, chloroplastic [Vigna radiata var. radiata]|uniref:RHOMBOID-like protein 9, chloroplastic n=1 Tax=Vigna radiata var. radiata TaxID=3916 RepID=A0A1S3V390_VIGRR|nr:RHOMBOID-like protein 9, chloroplastic [Vigna radiata var. radiata]XP_022641341.1 RHOMBOID-like protein 9, chloroplastic [Vigna radiata var. radiata]
MAAFPMFYKMPCKDKNLPAQNVIRQSEKRFIYNMKRSIFSIPGQMCRSCQPWNKVNNALKKSNTAERNVPRCRLHDKGSMHKNVTRLWVSDNHLSLLQGCYSKKENLSRVWCSAGSSSTEKQLRSLDSYFGKLQDIAKLRTFDSSHKVIQEHRTECQTRSETAIESLDEYLGKINHGANQESRMPYYVENSSEENFAPKQSVSKDIERSHFRKQNAFVGIRRIKEVHGPRSATDSLQNFEISSLYLIGILVSVNIAVVLFEIASPVRTSDVEMFSIPLLYGAKINHLIMVGEWWRLITPMFLHAGIFHMALSCWALVTFGPQVCKGYGSFTFFLIYILGGIACNFTSFLHTSDPTVGGTGPVFAIIGAWLMYQIQNKDVIASDTSENLFQKAIIITALMFILSHFGPIDEWSHFGAAFSGMAYGFLTIPTFQLNDTSSGASQEEGLKLVRKQGDFCKSLFIFTIFIIALSSFLLFMEPPPNALASLNAAGIDALEYVLIFG